MPFIKTRGLNIHYEMAGAGPTPIVLVHGNFASWRWWRPILKKLPPDYRAYAPDLRGCGDTDHPSNGYTIKQLAKDLFRFVTKLELTSFHLVGHSLGGAVALQFALDHPDRVQSLLLVAPAPADGLSFFKNRNNSTRLSYLFDPQRDASRDLMESNYRLLRTLEANRPMLRRALRRMAPSLATDTPFFRALVDDAARMAPEAVVGFLQTLDEWNVETELESLQLPVLILWGQQDILIPLPALQRMVKRLKYGKLVVWKSVGHSPQLEQPGHFVRLLIRFINQDLPSETAEQSWSRQIQRRIKQTLGRWRSGW